MSFQPPVRVVERFLEFLKPYKGLIFTAAVGNLFTVGIVMLTPLATKFLIDEAIPSRNVALALGIGITYFCLNLIRYAVGDGHVFLVNYTGQRAVLDIRRALYHHLQYLHLSFY